MLLDYYIQDTKEKYKTFDDKLQQLTYPEAKSILETLDENIRIQAEYGYSQLSEDLILDWEDVTLVQDNRNLS
jgi:hypothetical protein